MSEPTTAPLRRMGIAVPDLAAHRRRRHARRGPGEGRRALVARGPAGREGPPGPRAPGPRRCRDPPDAGGVQRPDASPRIRRGGLPRRWRPRHRVRLRDRPAEPGGRGRGADTADAGTRLAVRRLRRRSRPQPAPRDSRGPRTGDDRAARRGREQPRRDRPRHAARSPYWSRGADFIAAPRLSPAGDRSSRGSSGRTRTCRGTGRSFGWPTSPQTGRSAKHHGRRQPDRLDRPAALVARWRPPLRRRAERLDEHPPARRWHRRTPRRARGGVRAARLAVRLFELRLPARRIDRRDRPQRRPGPALPARAEARASPMSSRCPSARWPALPSTATGSSCGLPHRRVAFAIVELDPDTGAWTTVLRESMSTTFDPADIAVAEAGRVSDDGRQDRIRALLRAAERGVSRPRRGAAAADRHEPRRPDRRRQLGARRQHPAVHEPRLRRPRRRLRREHRLRSRLPQAPRGRMGRRRSRRLCQRRARTRRRGPRRRGAARDPRRQRERLHDALRRHVQRNVPGRARATSVSATSRRSSPRLTSSNRAISIGWSGRIRSARISTATDRR